MKKIMIVLFTIISLSFLFILYWSNCNESSIEISNIDKNYIVLQKNHSNNDIDYF